MTAQPQALAYRVIRYTPHLIRDEWLNLGVLLIDPARARVRVRVIEEPEEYARVRRMHPAADEGVLRAFAADFEKQFAEHAADPLAFVGKLDETLSNLIQLSPQHGVMAEDFDAELERLYGVYVAAPRFAPRAADVNSRVGIRARIGEVFRLSGIWPRTERGVRVEEFTQKGDPFRLDFAFRRNGSRGFVHAIALGRDPAAAKVLAFTAERIRARLPNVEFAAVTEVEPRPDNERHQFVASLLAEQQVSLVGIRRLPEWANQLRAELH